MHNVVGIFDSGLGGLTVVKAIKKTYPDQAIIYLGDTARVPYGTRSVEIVQKFAVEDAKFLERQGVSQIIIACHTASALAFAAITKAVSVPISAMIAPTVVAIKDTSKTKRVGILGTRATINSHIYLKNLVGYAVVEQACPLLVPLIEEGEVTGPVITAILKRYLQPIKAFDPDTVVLACTHYPIIQELIHKELGSSVQLINPGEALAKGLILSSSSASPDKYYVTDLTPRYQEVAESFLDQTISPELVQL